MQLLDDINDILVAISQVVNMERTPEQLFATYGRAKDQALQENEAIQQSGEDLIRWLNTPMIGADRQVIEDDSRAADGVEEKMRQLRKKVHELSMHWAAQERDRPQTENLSRTAGGVQPSRASFISRTPEPASTNLSRSRSLRDEDGDGIVPQSASYLSSSARPDDSRWQDIMRQLREVRYNSIFVSN